MVAEFEDFTNAVMKIDLRTAVFEQSSNLLSLLTQMGWKSRIQSVITEEELVVWYEKACRGKHSEVLGKKLMGTLVEEMEKEFPSTGGISKSLLGRHYDEVKLFPPWS